MEKTIDLHSHTTASDGSLSPTELVQHGFDQGLEAIAVTDHDTVAGVMVQKMRLGQPDATGRQAPEVIEGADYVEDADLVIKALGFEPEDLPILFGQPDLPVTRWGTVKAAFETGATDMDGVYAIGDIVRGASLVVWAIRDGRDCADAIIDRFNAKAAIAAE